ncbi:MAG TPA: tetratricopeptide repeat-containing glycosyltransferase family protein [Candidatus Kryptonia bacterium]|nr:tetratricopeptide repeat-containing glycosyltransferase family protein [Candidatus Kryptonia bacterium]
MNESEIAVSAQAPASDAAFDEALLLQRQGNATAAEQLYRALLGRNPDHSGALQQLSLLCLGRDEFEEAARLLGRWIAREPNVSGAHNNLGIALKGLNRPAEAVAHFRKAIELEPNRAETWYSFGRAQQVLGRLAEARECYERAIALRPDHAEADNALAVLLAPTDPEQALACFRRAIAARPAYADGHNNMGILLHALGRHEEAVASYKQALAVKPDHADAHNNLGLSLRDLNRHEEAVRCFELAQAIEPGHVDAHVNEALVRLALGDYATGWKQYVWRLHAANFSKGKTRPAQPLWLRQCDISGRTILLHGEQGLGDTIQFARFVPQVAELGAKVILAVQRPLTALMAGLAGASVVRGQGDPVPPFDAFCPLPSLPLAFETTLATIPADVPYLSAPADRLAKWRAALDALARPRIGLMWTRGGSPQDRRSLPLRLLLPLMELRDIQFVALQKELPDGELALLQSMGVPSFPGECLADLADTAAIIAMLDLVITIDTSIAHVAGALGKPMWVLLPFSADWRWLRDRSDSPWYPTARLFRQPAPGDWQSLVRQVAEALAELRLAAARA